MLNRIVFTEKGQIMTLKVIDELRNGDLHLVKHTIEKRLASCNSRKITLDFNNLQVISLDTQELLASIIKYFRLQKIPVSFAGSSKLDPIVLLKISEGKLNLIKKKKKKEQIVKDKPRYFPIFKIPFFSNKKNNELLRKTSQKK